MKELSTDIVVIAGGLSGLSAAVQASENGADVIILEKAANCGGAANMGMGPLGINSHFQRQQMDELTVEKALKLFMEYTHYQANARLVKRYFELSGQTIEWLESIGVEFEGAFRAFPGSEATWHIVKSDLGIGPRTASFMIKRLVERATELGVNILTETPAKKIIMENGRVAGVTATCKDGEELRVSCKAVIVATGGAGGSPEQIRELTGLEWGRNMFNTAVPGLTGDGLRMAWEAGADRHTVRIERTATLLNEGLPLSVLVLMRQPGLLVNAKGKRFMNEREAKNNTFFGNAVAQQVGAKAFAILDMGTYRYFRKNGLDGGSFQHANPDISDFVEGMTKAREEGNKEFFMADTLEELAQLAGIDVERFLETVDMYNEYCESGDEEFFKERKWMHPIAKGPFFAGTIHPGGYGTVGGIEINENCEAVDVNDDPVPGLYASGADACNIYEDSYCYVLPGNSMGFAVNTGRIAAMSAAEYINM